MKLGEQPKLPLLFSQQDRHYCRVELDSPIAAPSLWWESVRRRVRRAVGAVSWRRQTRQRSNAKMSAHCRDRASATTKTRWRVDECQCELVETQRACSVRALRIDHQTACGLATRSWIFNTLIAIERKTGTHLLLIALGGGAASPREEDDEY